MTLEQWQEPIDVDLTGAFLCAQTCGGKDGQSRSRGRIINVTSVQRRRASARGWSRPGDAYEIAGAIAFLAGSDAEYVTGASLVVDGGLLLMAAVPNQG